MNPAIWVPIAVAALGIVGVAINEVLKSRRERSARLADERHSAELQTIDALSDRLVEMLKSEFPFDPGERVPDQDLVDLRIGIRRDAERLRDPNLRREVIALVHLHEYVFEVELTPDNDLVIDLQSRIRDLLEKLYCMRML